MAVVQTESEPRVYSVFRRVCGVSAHVLCVVFTCLMVVLSKPGTSLFSWHPFLMTLAFSFLMTEAVLLFSPHSSPVRRFKHQTKARLHWILQSLSCACAVAGLLVMIYNKHLNAKPHLSSWHGLLGALCVCAVLVQSLAGLPLIFPGLAKGCCSLAKLKRYHAAAGLLSYLLGSVSLLLGLCSIWFTGTVSGSGWYLTALCPTVPALVVMSQVTSAYVARKRLQY